ncbi:MAG: hypothetical protein AAGF83_17405 [Cyanobacteria bacterium P01_G01_bin.67]
MLLKEPIKRNRLILAFVITFIVVDTCPHPNLPPGFIQTGLQQIQQTVLPESDHNK